MKEILGNELEKAFEELHIDAQKTFQSTKNSDFRQVWKLSDDDFKRICNIKDDDWHDDWGWWRSAEGSNIFGSPTHIIRINNHEINVYYDENKLDDYIESFLEEEYIEDFDSEEDAREQLVSDFFNDECQYKDFQDYCCEQWGASTERNVTAIAVETARLNNISLGELMNKYQG